MRDVQEAFGRKCIADSKGRKVTSTQQTSNKPRTQKSQPFYLKEKKKKILVSINRHLIFSVSDFPNPATSVSSSPSGP
jgi:hypothetical protein